jgi:hypothetical protein
VHKGAIADNVPHRDLHVTKGHALYIDGVLIPVEFLVNHRSIVWDDRARDIAIYHIELETHDVLIADGAPAETYRDDGNRWLFQNINPSWHLPPQIPCASVLTGGPIVDGIWRHLLDRTGPRPNFALTNEADVHLLVDGERIDGRMSDDGRYLFCLNLHKPCDVWIVSRASAPDELGLTRDPRQLGIAIQRIMIWRGARLRLIEASDPLLRIGFNGYEPAEGIRWTTGEAQIAEELLGELIGSVDVELLTTHKARYLDEGIPFTA